MTTVFLEVIVALSLHSIVNSYHQTCIPSKINSELRTHSILNSGHQNSILNINS